jgi:minor extracellular serine protease Vpr
VEGGIMSRKIITVMIAVLMVMSLIVASPLHVSAKVGKISTEFSTEMLNSKNEISVIVELFDEPVIPFQIKSEGKPFLQSMMSQKTDTNYAEKLSIKQQKVFNAIKRICPDAKMGYTYQYVYNGFGLKIRGDEVSKIASIPGVKKVFPVRYVTVKGDFGDKVVGAPDVWKMKDAKGNPLDGTGELIGIIDTGIDYKHPDLGGGFGPGYKVVGGYDFGDNDPDPMDLEGHGTHVAGIAAANGKIKGVAPNAKLMAYKIVPGGQGSASTEAIIAAIEQAVKDKCDAVNLSFGSGSLGTADPDDPENKAFDNAADAGVLSAIAAGNQGARSKSTPYPLGSPSGAPKVISVAAADDAAHPAIDIVAPKGFEKEIMGDYADVSPKFPDGEFEVVNCGYGSKADFYGKDLTGKIALVSRGPIGENALYFRDKVLNAEAVHAAGVIIYNNIPGIVSPTLVVTSEDANKKFIPTIFITEVDGRYLKKLLNMGLKVKFTETNPLDTIASFSSMGPTSDFFFKPEISAPGVAIYSTIPGGKYASWQGTSMATPFVTGSIALMKQAHPSWTSAQIKAVLMETSHILKNPDSGNVISWTLQGSGRLYIPDAIDVQAAIMPYDILVHAKDIKPVKFTVHNFSDSAQSFSVTTVLTSQNDDGITPVTGSFTVPASSDGTYTYAFKVDANKLSEGPHEGVIFFKSKSETLHVPFIIWKGDVSIPKTLSDVSTSSDTLVPGKTNISFNFTLGTGSIIPPTDINGRPTNSNIIDEMQISILDADGKKLGVIYDKALLLVGSYTFTWDGRNLSGNYFLKDGTYQWQIAAIESNGSETNPVIDNAAVASGTFKVENAPKNIVTAMPPDSFTQGTSASGSVNADIADELSEMKFVLTFDSANVTVASDSVKLGDFFKNRNDLKTQINVDNVVGEVQVDIKGDIKPGKGTLLNFSVKGRIPGNVKFDFRDASLLDKSGKPVMSLFVPGFSELKEAPNPWDLNRDNKVDNTDVQIFEKSFGTEVGSPDFNPQADFNKDGVIDGKDLIILAMHLGETYNP